MKLETFIAGSLQQRYQYKSFEPVQVNHEWLWEDTTINTLLEQANRALGELNAFSLIVPDIEAGNILYKSIISFTDMVFGSVVAGADVPLVITSRVDSEETKLASIALASYMMEE